MFGDKVTFERVLVDMSIEEAQMLQNVLNNIEGKAMLDVQESSLLDDLYAAVSEGIDITTEERE